MIDPNDKIGNINLYDFSNAIVTLEKLESLSDKLNNLGIELACCDEYNKSISTIKNLLVAGMGFVDSEYEEYYDEIEYYCYDRKFGQDKSLGDCLLNGKNYSLNSIEDLWIWLKALSERKN